MKSEKSKRAPSTWKGGIHGHQTRKFMFFFPRKAEKIQIIKTILRIRYRLKLDSP